MSRLGVALREAQLLDDGMSLRGQTSSVFGVKPCIVHPFDPFSQARSADTYTISDCPSSSALKEDTSNFR